MSKIPTVIFNYRVEDILDEVTKRTSYTGKMRRSEQEPYLVDRLSLTRGEDFMFSEFLEEAVSETYDWLRAFGRKIPMYDKIVLKYEDMKMYKDCGAYAFDRDVINGDDIPFEEFVPLSNVQFTELFDDGKLYITHNTIVLGMRPNMKDAKVMFTYKATINTIHNGNQMSKVIEVTEEHLISTDNGAICNTVKIPFPYIEDGIRHEIGLVKVEMKLKATLAVVEPIKKDTYVEYHYNLDNLDMFDVYQVTVDCTTDNWMDYACKQAVDPRGCVIFILERTDHMDLNLISSIDRDIKEALINYIIYKWFEYTNAEEADKFYLKFDYHGQKAQIGMNSETKIVQRKYNINH